MRMLFFRPTCSFLSWVRRLRRGGTTPRRRSRQECRLRPTLELLEDRLAPASLTDSGGTLTIFLHHPSETLPIRPIVFNQYSLTSSTGTLFNSGLKGATYTATASTGTLAIGTDGAIAIVDSTAGTSVTFNDSLAASYQQPFSVALANPL